MERGGGGVEGVFKGVGGGGGGGGNFFYRGGPMRS